MGFDDDHDNERATFFRYRRKYDHNSKMLIIAVVSISSVVLFAALFYVYYVRCVLRRQQARRRSAIRPHSGIITISNAEEQQSPPKTGLDRSVIASLPVFVFKRRDINENGSPTPLPNDFECPVCLGILEDGETARVLPNCKHTFHTACIDTWFASQTTCPVCRTNAEQRMIPEHPDGCCARVPISVRPTAPPLEFESSSAPINGMEGTSGVEGAAAVQLQSSSADKVINGSSSSELSSFRRMLSRERSSQSQRLQP